MEINKVVNETSQTIEKRDRRYKKHHELKAADYSDSEWVKKAAETSVNLLRQYNMI